MKTVVAYFYAGEGLPGWVVRSWTRSRFAHCTVAVGDVVYEAIPWRSRWPWWYGEVTKRPANHYEATAVAIPCPWVDPDAVQMWCEAQLGKRYDFPAVFISGLNKWFRGGFRLEDNRVGAYDCSRLVTDGLGLDASRLFGPPSPQDAFDLVSEKTNANH